MDVHYTAEARLEFLESLKYYEQQQEGLAVDFYQELIAVEQSIKEFPEFWHKVGGDYRRKHLKRYPYSLVYQIRQDYILIVAVAPSRREKDYWREREGGQ